MQKYFKYFPILFCTIFITSCMTPQNEVMEDKNQAENKAVIEIQKNETVSKIDYLETTDKNHEIRITELEGQVKKLNFLVNDLSQDNIVSKKIISLLRNDVNSLNEQLSTNKKEIDILKRGLRSGIFEDQASLEKQPPSSLGVSMLPDMTESRDIYTEKKDSSLIPLESAMMNSNEPIGPAQLIADAEIKLRQAHYGEAIISLNNVKKNYPNYDDKGKSLLLSSEAWLRLGEYNNVFNELRTFYIKFPNTPDLAHAKLLEAETYEKLNSKSKAAQIYQEVITLSPQSTDAQNARDGMLRMRDSK